MSRNFIVGKNKSGVSRLKNDVTDVNNDDVFIGYVSNEEADFLFGNISDKAFDEFDIDIWDCEYDEIPNDLVDYFVDLIGDDKEKCPVFYQALMYAKESGGIIQVCF